MTGVSEHAVWASYVRHGCLLQSGSVCGALSSRWNHASRWNEIYLGVLYVIPGLLGLGVGAPIVARELETGTNRFAWTQSVKRTSWLGVKLAIGALAVVAISDALALFVQWWSAAGYRQIRIQPKIFDVTGLVLVGYTVFAFSLGAALGAVLRRTGWAIAVGAVVYGGFRLFVRSAIRPALVHPQAYLGYNAPPSNVWTLGAGVLPLNRLTPSPGHQWLYVSPAIDRCFSISSHSPRSTNPLHVFGKCLASAHLHQVVDFIPASDYSRLQALETGIFLGAAAVLLVFTVFMVHKWQS
ncbi:MAG: hypothetical protein ACYDEP_02260 [Acidimicrobiales bacterium]